MARKVTISIDEDILSFVDREAAGMGHKANRSGYINSVLAQERQRRLESELAEAYQRDAKDASWRDEASAWDAMAGDGINA